MRFQGEKLLGFIIVTQANKQLKLNWFYLFSPLQTHFFQAETELRSVRGGENLSKTTSLFLLYIILYFQIDKVVYCSDEFGKWNKVKESCFVASPNAAKLQV